jgi:hypothetical protein
VEFAAGGRKTALAGDADKQAEGEEMVIHVINPLGE